MVGYTEHANHRDTVANTGFLVDYMRKQGDGAREHNHSDLNDVENGDSPTARSGVPVESNLRLNQRGLLPGHTIWNPAVNYNIGRATMFFTVKNLLDDIFIVDRSRGILPGSPRLLHAGIRTRF